MKVTRRGHHATRKTHQPLFILSDAVEGWSTEGSRRDFRVGSSYDLQHE